MKLLVILFLLKTKSEGKYSESRLQCVILEKNLQITLECFSHRLIL